MRSTTALLSLALLFPVAGLSAQADDAGDPPPLYDDLGAYHYPIATSVPEAQAYFDQGLRLYYAFNHQEAVRSFRESQRLDDRCAMCWWGEALAWGPNINLPMDEPSGRAAWAALQGALERRAHASAKEQALIDALALRYEAEPPADRAYLDRAWAEALGELANAHPDDAEIRVLHAEALMDLRPWDYWTAEGEPQPGIAEVLEGLRYVQDLNPQHPGGCHFYIHAVEKLFPEDAVACAERLAGMMPGAGHLVHMPGHIYIRVGRYRDAIQANKHAIHADETYIRDQRPGMGMYTAGYYPHNYDFLAFASMMVGDGEATVEAASQVATLIPAELYGATGMDFLQHWSMRPLLFQVRFERWDAIQAVERPREDRPHAMALWHYAQGRAAAAQGDLQAARDHLTSLQAVLHGGALEGLRMEFNRSVDLIPVAQAVLAGRIAAAEGHHGEAAEELQEAVRLEDALLYGEPPEWSVPTRQDLGEVLLEGDRPEEAEAVFRADLDRFPRNVWSLEGLEEALRRQGRTAEADDATRELARARSGEGG